MMMSSYLSIGAFVKAAITPFRGFRNLTVLCVSPR
jgi:hypothetical protein